MPDGHDRLKKVLEAIERLTNLVIITSVNEEGEPKEMKTTIDLVQGDIKNEIDAAFVTGDLKDLREYHAAQVLKGQQIIRDNIAALKDLYLLIRSTDGGST